MPERPGGDSVTLIERLRNARTSDWFTSDQVSNVERRALYGEAADRLAVLEEELKEIRGRS